MIKEDLCQENPRRKILEVSLDNPLLNSFSKALGLMRNCSVKEKRQLAKSVISRNRINGDLFQLRSRGRSIDCKQADQLSEKL